MRIGHGFDVHQLVAGRRLVIGGVEIPYDKGLGGHSDADVLLHAVTDALLGAAGLGDIGQHFPDTEERWRGADSIELLRLACGVVANEDLRVVNVDATLVLEAPKIGPHRHAMREKLAEAIGVPVRRVNVKATTGEGVGFVGRGEGAAAMAVAMLEGV